MKRVTWFVTGVATGAAGAGYAVKKVKRTASQLAPANVVKGAATRARDSGRKLADAVREGRAAMHAREDELKARRDARVATLDEHLDPGDQLLVDGRPVDSGRVIVLKQKR
ncbi:MAG TPA: hypothetical protein VIS05_05660 [Ilumatobacter sp.]